MAKINKKMLSFFFKWEGGLSRDPKDSASSYPNPMEWEGKKGWHTNMGITYKTWTAYHGKNKKRAFFEMTEDDVIDIFKRGYWDKVKADKIKSDAIAVCLTSWAWGSGSDTAIRQIQRLLGVTVDGIIGKNTLKAINDYDEVELFYKMVRLEGTFSDISQAKKTHVLNNKKLDSQTTVDFCEVGLTDWGISIKPLDQMLNRSLLNCLGWLLTAFVIFSGCSPQWHIEKAQKHTKKAIDKGAVFSPDTTLEIDTVIINSVTLGDTVFTDRIIYKTEFITGEIRYITKKDKRKERKRQRTLDKREFKLEKIKTRGESKKSYWYVWLLIGLILGYLLNFLLKRLLVK